MAKSQPLTMCTAKPMILARSRCAVKTVPMMNGMSIRVSPNACPTSNTVVRTVVAARPHRRTELIFMLWLLGYWVAGLLGYWVAGLLGCWVAGLLGYWVAGLLGCWVTGLLGYWVAGLLSNSATQRPVIQQPRNPVTQQPSSTPAPSSSTRTRSCCIRPRRARRGARGRGCSRDRTRGRVYRG